MNNRAALHHVYSSIKGYSTIYISPSLEKHREKLELYSRKMGGIITEGFLVNSFICGSQIGKQSWESGRVQLSGRQIE